MPKSTRNIVPNLAGRLRELREAAGLSARDLAAQVGAGPVAVYQIEAETRTPSLCLAYRLADALGVTTDTLREPAGSPIRKRKVG